MRTLLIFLVSAPLVHAQGRGAPAAPATNDAAARAAFIRETYSKFEYRIPVRDGVKRALRGGSDEGNRRGCSRIASASLLIESETVTRMDARQLDYVAAVLQLRI